MDSLRASRYALLRNFRRDGRPIDTPIWFHLDGTTLVFRTKIGPKTKRITNDSRVEVRVCDYKGRVPDATPTLTGRAVVLSGEDAQRANRQLREKWRHLRNPNLWPESAIVRVDLAAQTAGTK